MGANNVLPTIPVFNNNAPSLADLNNLSYAVSFLADCDVRPTFKLYTTANQAITASAYHAVTLASVAVDSDGVSDGTGATIVTQGYYAVEGMVQIETTTATFGIALAFNLTGHGLNPHLASGATLRFGERADAAETVTASADTALCTSAVTPIPLYPGDTVRLQVYTTVATTVRHNNTPSYQAGRFVPNLSGYLVRLGS